MGDAILGFLAIVLVISVISLFIGLSIALFIND
jgi:hypothetical protein